MVKKKKHVYVLDTNILMKYPNAVFGFDDNEVVITSTTQEELDNHKNDKGEKGMLTRHSIAVIDRLREEAHEQGSNLSKGVKINNGRGLFRVEPDNITENLAQGWTLDKPDNRILSCCKNLNGILVTEDGNMRNKADVIGIEAQSYHNVEIKSSGYTGRSEIYLSSDDFSILAKGHKLDASGIKDIEENGEFVENEYFIIRNADDPVHTVLAKFSGGYLLKIREKFPIGKITLRNAGQHFAMDALFDDNVPLVILSGPAGTAKTFLSVVAGMAGVRDKWSQIIATRNNIEMDRSIGALPGNEDEKVGPLLRGVQDALRVYYIAGGTAESDVRMSIDDTFQRGDVDIEALGFMRGRSISNSFVIIDECQNTSAHQIESLITRAGENCKVVCCGDPGQIDDPKLDSKTNGLTFAMETMKGSKLCAQITFTEDECERSELAREAASRMGDALS